MVKAVGARTCAWLYGAAVTPGVLAVLVMVLGGHLLLLPERGSLLGAIVHMPLSMGGCRCGRASVQVVLVPDGPTNWRVAEDERGPAPGGIVVDFMKRRSSRGFAAPTRRWTVRTLAVYDEQGGPVSLTAQAAGVAREWFEAYAGWGADFDHALAGRVLESEAIPEGYVQNGVLVLQAMGVAWCVIARAWARSCAGVARRRRGAGLCEACAYPVFERGSVCPECGRAYADA